MGLIPNLEIMKNNTKSLKLSSCLNNHTQKWFWAIKTIFLACPIRMGEPKLALHMQSTI